MKKLISGLFTIVMTVAIVATSIGESIYSEFSTTMFVNAYYYGDFEYYTLNDGTVEISHYKGTDTKVDIPNEIYGKDVTGIRFNAFKDCKKILIITIPDSVKYIDNYAFSGCSRLTSVIIPDNVTRIGYGAFKSCVNLNRLTIGKGVINIENEAFYNCNSLTSVTIPGSVNKIGTGVFQDCVRLSQVTIENGVNGIGDYAFYGCTNLTSISIPESVTSIGNYTFYKCSSLTNVSIPENVATIGNYTFNYCSSLKSIIIPKSVTRFGYSPFSDCSIPLNIYYTGTKEDWSKISFDTNYNHWKHVNIYYNYAPQSAELQGKIYYQQNLKDNSQIRFIAEVGIDDIEKANKGNYSVKVGDNEFGDEFYTAYLSIIANGKQVKAGDGKCFVVTPVVKQIPKGIDVTSIFNIDTYYIGLKRTISF